MNNVFLNKPSKKITEFIKKKYEKLIPLYFEAKEAGCTVKLKKEEDPYPIDLQTSVDRITWIDYTIDSEIFLSNIGDRVYFKQKKDTGNFSGSIFDQYYFVVSNCVECHGNIMSLAYNNFYDKTCIKHEWQFAFLFYACNKKLLTAPILPANTLNEYCYYAMFSGCTSLVNAPELPAAEIEEGCYEGMFSGCTSLVNAPELPATEIKYLCYRDMFRNCTSLTSAPTLPAAEIEEGCYEGMFSGCTSLSSAPALPATTLADYCYNYMFSGCSSLTSAPALPATTLAVGCYQYMFSDCTKFSECHMKEDVNPVTHPETGYTISTHGDTTKTVVYDLT